MATASKALNGRDRVSDRTRAKVRAAADRLGYVPRHGASKLRLGGTVGIIASDLSGRFALPIMMGAEDSFGLGAISVIMCDARGDAIRERHHLRALLERRVDGIIVVGSSSSRRPTLGANLGVPLVYAYAPSDADDDVSADVDHVAAGRIGAEHLIQVGSTDIAIVGGVPGVRATAERVRGAREAITQAGLRIAAEGPLAGEFSEMWGRAASRAVVTREPGVNGFLCGNDQIARGVAEMLRDLGREVPGSARVVGNDNWEPIVLSSRPPLTSVDLNLEALGRLSAELLLAAVDGDPRPGRHQVVPRLVVRDSTLASS
jgi:LacI family transcriptional regulator